MPGRVIEVAGRRAFLLEPDGPPIASERDAAEIVGETFAAEARLVVIPLERLSPAFLDLKTGLVGEVLQKFVNYRRQPVILGDIATATATAASRALADFVRESNRGASVWFLPDLAALEAKLSTP